MIININGERRINYDNVIDEQIVERNNGSIKVKFTFVNSSFTVLLMSEEQYDEFKIRTANPTQNTVIDVTCSIVQLLRS